MSRKRSAIELFDDFLFRYLTQASESPSLTPCGHDADSVRQAIRDLESPALAPDSPEALRFAAQVVRRLDPRMRQVDTSVAGFLEHEALRVEEKNRADSEREARAQRAYEVWRAPMSVSWNELGADRQVVWRAVADALKDGE